ncbi:MAG: phosphate acyltransferase PlsX [Candidatus Omnitrophica bacterium]|nr:phosphate acyltransferase PlsX [Candidatus Omnitrophota bacterium]
MRIVLDAMGGDKAPENPVKGAVMAVKEYGYEVTLVGREKEIRKELEGEKYPEDKLSVVNVPEVIDMEEPAAVSVRKKRNSSIVKGLEMVKDKTHDAFVSAGNTGAVVCAATLSLRLLPGIDRPGIAVVFPTLAKPILVIDVGANIDPKPLHMLQYGVMGDAYSRHLFGKEDPSVGLLNIGEESSKGTDFEKESHALLKNSKLNFIGNVEPKEVYKGSADVVLSNGFVGNVFLKVTEAFAYAGAELLKTELKRSGLLAQLGALMMLPSLKKIKKRVDSSEHGGAPLLGVDGRVIIAHGSSNPKAVKNAIRVAGEFYDHQVNKHILEELQTF